MRRWLWFYILPDGLSCIKNRAFTDTARLRAGLNHPHQIQPAKRRSHEKRVKSIQEAAMAGHDVSAVLDPRHAFQLAFQQVAISAGDRRDEDHDCPADRAKLVPIRALVEQIADAGHD